MARLKGYKLCPKCGQPILKKGQTRKHPDDYRHAQGCPNDDIVKQRLAKDREVMKHEAEAFDANIDAQLDNFETTVRLMK